jgi:DtxR family transcriptional regulator, Mn-dependent transcriptional regulator
MSEKHSAIIENYLGVMYVLQRDGEPMAGVRLAELLNVTPPTVTNTLKRMVRDGLVTMDARHGPHLTEEGHAAAQTLMRKHMLAELMLFHFALPWSKVHKQAHEFEHAISDELESALISAFGNPDICPHGNPLPGHEDAVTDWIPLSQAEKRCPLIVRRIHELAEDKEDIMVFLEENRIELGREIEIEEVLPFNQTMNVSVLGKTVSLGLTIARYIFVAPTARTSEVRFSNGK